MSTQPTNAATEPSTAAVQQQQQQTTKTGGVELQVNTVVGTAATTHSNNNSGGGGGSFTSLSSSSSVVNKSHHGIKRIMSEMRELQKNPSSDYEAHPLDDNLFEWHFTIAGTKDTAFEGGIYHGRIILPPEYPHKPPDIVLLTPSGRFEVNTKICLSLTSYHPESWTPQWGIRTVLIALQGFFPTEAKGIGSIDYPDSVRRKLAVQSRKWKCDVCGTCNDEVLVVEATTTPQATTTSATSTTTTTANTKTTDFVNTTSTIIEEETKSEVEHQCHHQHHHHSSQCVKSRVVQNKSSHHVGPTTPKPATTTKPSIQNNSGETSTTTTAPKKSAVWFLDLLIVAIAMLISYIVYIKFSSTTGLRR